MRTGSRRRQRFPDAPDIGVGSQTIHNAQQHCFVLRGIELDKFVYESRVCGSREERTAGPLSQPDSTSGMVGIEGGLVSSPVAPSAAAPPVRTVASSLSWRALCGPGAAAEGLREIEATAEESAY